VFGTCVRCGIGSRPGAAIGAVAAAGAARDGGGSGTGAGAKRQAAEDPPSARQCAQISRTNFRTTSGIGYLPSWRSSSAPRPIARISGDAVA